MKKILIGMFLITLSIFALTIGSVPPQVIIEKKSGGYLDGTAWSSSMLKNKLYVLFYVDPDERDTNNAFINALEEKKYDLNYYGSVAIVNLAATWLPNVILESKLKEKQKRFPNAIYIKDKKKVLVKEWSLADNSSNVLILNKKGELIYLHSGKLTEEEITQVLQLIDKNL